ncbi:MAG: GreA/GreB family elongation factor [Alcanivorax sp.]|nr:GreA/GreB family elongation factor [Alcanivorax sp.]
MEGLLHPHPRAALHSRLEILELESREVTSLTLVRPEDSEPDNGLVSILSPLGQALTGRRRGQVTEAEFLGYRLPLAILNVIPLDQDATP